VFSRALDGDEPGTLLFDSERGSEEVLALSPDERFLLLRVRIEGRWPYHVADLAHLENTHSLPPSAGSLLSDSSGAILWSNAGVRKRTYRMPGEEVDRRVTKIPIDPEQGTPSGAPEVVLRYPESVVLWRGGLAADLENGRFLVARDLQQDLRPPTLVVIENWAGEREAR